MINPGPTLLSLLRAPVPEHLYHYTSVNGLDGIASSKSVWASAAQYLNDAKEFKLAVEIARRQVATAAHRERSNPRAPLLLYLHDQFERIEDFEVCIFSLTSEGDLLSQWRGYCPANGGYSIGLVAEDLRAVMAPQGGILARCEYDINAQEELVREALSPVLDSLPEAVPEDDGELEALGELCIEPLLSQLSFVAPLIKHYSFREEREWRLIWIPGRINVVELRYRAGRGTFIPYVALSLDFAGRSVPFGEVIVGPMPHQHMATNALYGFLQERSVTCRSIRHSQVPYRIL